MNVNHDSATDASGGTDVSCATDVSGGADGNLETGPAAYALGCRNQFLGSPSGRDRSSPPRTTSIPVAGRSRASTGTAGTTMPPGGCWSRPSASWRAGSAWSSGPAWPRSPRCCSQPPGRAPSSLLPSDGYYATRKFAETILAGIRHRGPDCARRPDRTHPSREFPSCCWRPRPIPDWTSVTSRRSLPRPKRRGRWWPWTTPHRDPPGSAPAGAGSRPVGCLGDQGTDRPLRPAARLCLRAGSGPHGPDPRLAERSPGPCRGRSRPGWPTARSGTLDLRLARQEANAAALVEVLLAHPAVTGVRWPGHPEDPAAAIARKQMRRMPGLGDLHPRGQGRGRPLPHRVPADRRRYVVRRAAHQRGPPGPVGRQHSGGSRPALLRRRGSGGPGRRRVRIALAAAGGSGDLTTGGKVCR